MIKEVLWIEDRDQVDEEELDDGPLPEDDPITTGDL